MQIEQASHADSQKLSKKLAEREAELERERASAAKQHSERLEAMKKEQAALESKLAAQKEETKALHKKHEVEKRDRQLLEENLMHVIPMVNEANAIVTELGQALRYSIKLEAKRSLDDDGFTESTSVWIRVVNLEDDMEVLWDMDTLSEALYTMRDLYNQYYACGEIEIPSNDAENPFHLKPTGPMLIGTARLYLQPCYFLLPIHESTAIIDYKGEHKGLLYVNLIPIPPRDEDTLNLKEEELFFEEEELIELKGEPLTIRLEVKKCMGLPQKYAQNVVISYKFFDDSTEHKTEPVAPVGETSINPLVNYERTLLVDIIEEEFVEYVKSGILEFNVYGEQVVQQQTEEEKNAAGGKAGTRSKRGSIIGGGKKGAAAAAAGSSSGSGPSAAELRVAKLENVLREITEHVDPALEKEEVLRSPELITSKVKAMKDEVTELKSPAKQKQFAGLEAQKESEEAARAKAVLQEENAKIKTELESLRNKSGKSSAKNLFPAAATAGESAEETAALRAELEALKAASSPTVTAAAAAAEQENASLKAALESLRSKASPKENELAELRSSAAAHESALNALKETLAQKESEAAELRSLQAQEAALNKELAEKIAAGVPASATASVMGRNEAQVKELQRELESARAKVQSATPSKDEAAEIAELKRMLQEEKDKKKSSACVIL